MKLVVVRSAIGLWLGLGGQALFAGTALAHFGPETTPEHVLLEVAEWALAVVAVLGSVVLVFWVRAKGRRE